MHVHQDLPLQLTHEPASCNAPYEVVLYCRQQSHVSLHTMPLMLDWVDQGRAVLRRVEANHLGLYHLLALIYKDVGVNILKPSQILGQ